MDMDIDDTSKSKEEKSTQMVVILVGAPGSGKSTFCDNVMRSSSRSWARICQDTINNGKSGTKAQCLKAAVDALNEGKSIFIDRCNLDKEQRLEFVKLGNTEVEMHAVVLDLPARLCISRSVKRTGHEGKLQGGKAAAVVNRMLQKKELPKLSEGFSRITFCTNETDVENAVKLYSALGLSDRLPHGCFGQKNPDAKVQVGIMKFLKKNDASGSSPIEKNEKGSGSLQTFDGKTHLSREQETCSPSHVSSMDVVKKNEDQGSALFNSNVSGNDVPTLAFPSISTADFQFDLAKASDIIVEKVEEFTKKLGNGRLVMVDLSHGSKILSLVRTRAAQKNIDSERFSTFVGDITKLYSEGGLRCNVIANAANWRLKPGGGGVNAAIFKAAGSELEAATMERAKSLVPGSSLVVPLPSSSPLYSREGVTHVIHVLGPNMNPKRPNFLNGDYSKGCKILRESYTSLFEGFLSISKNEAKLNKRSSESIRSGSSKLENHTDNQPMISCADQKFEEDKTCEEDTTCESERSKKYKGHQDKSASDITSSAFSKGTRHDGKNNSKGWGSWAQALHYIAMNPERHENIVLEVSDDIVVISDMYPKARKHLLVLARKEGLDRLADVRKEHIPLLTKMHETGLKWVKKFHDEDASLVFRLGYHSAPSMRQLHLHVISQDFDSNHLKNKKHWNSFNTEFFRNSVDVMEEIRSHGATKVNDKDSILSMELRCHRCRSAHPNIPRLKSHILSCRAPFPSYLLHENRLVRAPSDTEG